MQQIQLPSRHLLGQCVYELADLTGCQWIEIQRQLNDFLQVFATDSDLPVDFKRELLIFDVDTAIDDFFVDGQQHEHVLQVEEEFDRFQEIDDLVRLAAVEIVDKQDDSGAAPVNLVGFGL